jgi:hypothetical protein
MTNLKQLASIAALATTFAAAPAMADTILTFGQTLGGSPITATEVGGTSTITGNNVLVTITGIECTVPCLTPIFAFMDFSASSTADATSIASFVEQPFSGSFSITSTAAPGGINYLSGTFTDAVFGSGASLTLSAAEPPGSVSFTSDLISVLGLGRGISLSFASVVPAVHTVVDSGHTTLAPFTASVSGTFSANVPIENPEPATLGLLGIALLGLGFVRRRGQG